MGAMGNAQKVADAVRGSTGRHSLGQRLAAIGPMLRDAFTGRWVQAPRGRLIASIVGLVYVVSPLDIMPELLLGPFGLGDDIAIIALCVASLMTAAESWLDREVTATAPGGAAPGGAAGGDVVEGVVINRR